MFNRDGSGNVPLVSIVILLTLLSLVAGAWMWELTEEGMGVGNDTVVYLAGGHNIYSGMGFNWFSGDGTARPINHYPFFFSVLLGLAFPFGIQVLTWARFLQVSFFVISNILLWLLVWRMTRSLYFSTLASLIFLASEEMLSLHSWLMSDALFLLLVLVFMLVTSKPGYSLGKSKYHLIGLAIIGTLAALTRYIGVSLIVVLTLQVISNSNRNFKQRINDGLIVFLFGVSPLLLWLGRNWMLTGSMTNRRSGWYPQATSWWSDVSRNILEMFIPGRVTTWLFEHPFTTSLGVAAGGIILYLGIRRYHRRTRDADNQHSLNSVRLNMIVFFVLIYSAGMIGSTLLSYPDPDVNYRTLAPSYICVLVLGLTIVARIDANSKGFVRVFMSLIPVLFIIFKLGSAQYTIRQLQMDGQGYLSDTWQNSETIAALRAQDPDLIYSDNIGAIYFFTGEYAFNVPVKYDAVTREIHENFQSSLNLMIERLRQSDGHLVLFNKDARLPEFAEPETLTENLVLIGEYKDGSIYSFHSINP